MDDTNLFAPTLPLTALVPGTLLSLLVLAIGWRSLRTLQGRFVLVALWLRYIFDVWPQYTLRPLVGGLTPIALLSVVTAGIGLLLIDRRLLKSVYLLPFYAMIGVVLLSALLNGDPAALLNQTVKFLYLIVVLVAAYQAMRAEGLAQLSGGLLWAFLPLFIFLAASVALGLGKVTNTDASIAYTGGFNHESTLALAFATGFVVACFATRIAWPIRLGFMVATLGALVLVNYRTVLIAIVPFVLWQFARMLVGTTRPGARPLVVMSLGVVGLFGALAVMGTSDQFGARFQDIVTIAQNPASLIRPPESFTLEERRFASARAYTWSQYAYAYANGRPLEQMIGHGPDSWEGVFRVYAQNTLLSYLYEFGALGAVMVMLLWATMLVMALRCAPPHRIVLVLMHLGFFLINMSTQPFWLVEGLLFYALLCAYTVHERRRAMAPRARSANGAKPVAVRQMIGV